MRKAMLRNRIQDRCYFDPCIRIWDLRNVYTESFLKIFRLKLFKFFCPFAQIPVPNFLYLFKNKIIFNFVKLMPKKVTVKQHFLSFFFVFVVESWIWDPGSEIREGKKSGSGINIPDTQRTRPWCSECPRPAGGRGGCGDCAAAVPRSRSKPWRNPAPV